MNVNAQLAPGKKTHSEVLMPLVNHLLTTTGISLPEVDFIACTNGPGSFTGLRIGAAAAKGLALGAGKPLIPVPTLDALAYNTGNNAAPGTIIVPLLDARRGQVYTALYRYDADVLNRITDYLAEPFSETLARLEEAVQSTRAPVIFLGDGVPVHSETIQNSGLPFFFAPLHDNRQRAAAVGARAMALAATGFYGTEADFTLLYVRKPQAVYAIDRLTGFEKDSTAASQTIERTQA